MVHQGKAHRVEMKREAKTYLRRQQRHWVENDLRGYCSDTFGEKWGKCGKKRVDLPDTSSHKAQPSKRLTQRQKLKQFPRVTGSPGRG